jgi:deoxycytidylate deaminase
MTCAKQTTTATVVALDGQRFVGTNACARPQTVCPRGGMPTGVGYHLCADVCAQTGHAEANACRLAGNRARGATLYLEGHYYACDDCRRIAAEHGIADIVLGPPPAQGGAA